MTGDPHAPLTASRTEAPPSVLPPPPHPQGDWAYFLDFDGTLVEIAERPSGVRVDTRLPALLRGLSRATHGAVALVTGRTIAGLDALLGQPQLAVAGQHGAERRDARGRLTMPSEPAVRLAAARNQLRELVTRYPQLTLEDKGLSLALHFRVAPTLASLAHRVMRAVQAPLATDYVLQAGKCVIELRPAGSDKGRAVLEYLAELPFAGRRPVFVGDDATDEHAFVVVNQHGGISVKVGHGRTRADFRLAGVDAVHEWLAALSFASE